MRTFEKISDDEKLKVKAIIDLENEILKLVIDTITNLNHDPQSLHVIASSFAMSIKHLDKSTNSNFLQLVLGLLDNSENEKRKLLN